ncbi:MAG: hypothetical protein ABW130_16145 [Candidatus Thiodiazotropha lotti]|nr:hypothetical protein [Candidatus Thiodiazotropha lotti]MCW4181777.1 hypothetical protein [Candidatus Thiodiazotropha weberae]
MFQKEMDSLLKEPYIATIAVGLGLFIVFAEGVTPNMLTIWNLVPVLVAYFVFKDAAKQLKIRTVSGAIGFLVFGLGFLLFAHLAWLLDWGETRTGSSTAGLIFLFAPIWSLVLGGVGYMVGNIVGRILENGAEKHNK